MTNDDVKVQKEFVDYGCGFRVVLQNVPMVRVRGVWTPDIDYNALHRAVALALAHKPTRLTGAQIRFIRQYFDLTLAEFGRHFDVTHPAVRKWEEAKDEPPAIKWTLERDLRLFIIERLVEDSRAIGDLYRDLRQPIPKRASPVLRMPAAQVGAA